MRRLLFSLFVCVLTLPCFAQAQLVRSAGFKIGTSAASQDWNYSSYGRNMDANTLWGVDVGAFIEWFTLPVFSVSTEGHYVQKGFKVTLPLTSAQSPDGNGTFVTLFQRVAYLSLPILARCRLDIASSNIYALAGPRVDFLLGYRDQGFGAVIKDFRSAELGLTLGLGLETTAFDRFMIGAEFRVSPTLQDSYSSNVLQVRNRSMEILFVLRAK